MSSRLVLKYQTNLDQRDNETRMEAAQVILFLVVIGLIRDKSASKARSVDSSINGVG